MSRENKRYTIILEEGELIALMDAVFANIYVVERMLRGNTPNRQNTLAYLNNLKTAQEKLTAPATSEGNDGGTGI